MNELRDLGRRHRQAANGGYDGLGWVVRRGGYFEGVERLCLEVIRHDIDKCATNIDRKFVTAHVISLQ